MGTESMTLEIHDGWMTMSARGADIIEPNANHTVADAFAAFLRRAAEAVESQREVIELGKPVDPTDLNMAVTARVHALGQIPIISEIATHDPLTHGV